MTTAELRASEPAAEIIQRLSAWLDPENGQGQMPTFQDMETLRTSAQEAGAEDQQHKRAMVISEAINGKLNQFLRLPGRDPGPFNMVAETVKNLLINVNNVNPA